MPPKEAVALAVSRVGESISASAATVVVALLTLLLASFGIYHDLGVPLAIGIVVMLAAGLTLLPALLTVLGRAVFWPSKTVPRTHADGVWGRIAGRLVQRPALTLSIGVVIFGVLALFATGFKPGGFGGDVTASGRHQRGQGLRRAHHLLPAGQLQPDQPGHAVSHLGLAGPLGAGGGDDGSAGTGDFTQLAGPLDPNGTPITPQQLQALHAELPSPKALVDSNRLTPPAGTSIPTPLYNAYLATAQYISTDGSTVQWEAGLKAGDPSTTAALNAVPAIRTGVAAVAHEVGATANGVAGEAPALYDVSNISDGDLRHIVPVAVLAIGIVLALVLRSLIAPLYLILSVVLSYLASLGISVIVFIKVGNSGGIVFLLPFLMFIFLLALGEDYNILVMTRIREEAEKRPLRSGGGQGRRSHWADRDVGRSGVGGHLRRAGRRRGKRVGQRSNPSDRLRPGHRDPSRYLRGEDGARALDGLAARSLELVAFGHGATDCRRRSDRRGHPGECTGRRYDRRWRTSPALN